MVLGVQVAIVYHTTCKMSKLVAACAVVLKGQGPEGGVRWLFRQMRSGHSVGLAVGVGVSPERDYAPEEASRLCAEIPAPPWCWAYWSM